ncbi:MAG: hypothetical protein ACT4OD_01325, partial [Candidatus Nitrosotenuis sp.]
SLTERLGITDTVSTSVSKSLSESLGLTDTLTKSSTKSLSESLGGMVPVTPSVSKSLSEQLGISETILKMSTKSVSDRMGIAGYVVSAKNLGANQILVNPLQPIINTTQSNMQFFIATNVTNVQNYTITQTGLTNISLNYSQIKSGNTVTLESGPNFLANLVGSSSYDVTVDFPNNIVITGPSGWSGVVQLPQLTTATVPSQTSGSTTTTYSDVTAMTVGLDSQTLTFNSTVKLIAVGKGGNQGFVGFFITAGSSSVTLLSTCSANPPTLSAGHACYIEEGSNIAVFTTHFTTFGTAKATSSSSGSASSSTASSADSSGGGGGVGVGPSRAAQGIGAPGTVVNPIILYQVTYDTCETNMIRIIAGAYGQDALPPHVKIRTPDREIYSATLAKEQPYLEHNKIFKVSRYVYEAPLKGDAKYFVITAEHLNDRLPAFTSYFVNVHGCTETVIINPMTGLEKIPVNDVDKEGVPHIFDIKFQVGDNKPVLASEVNQFIQGNEKVRITGIVDSLTDLRRAELRVVPAGSNYTDYAAVKMSIHPLTGVKNTYFVSADLPTSFLHTPAIVYWLHIVNQEEMIQASEKYYLGVKPDYQLDARLELDTPIAKSQSSIFRPSAYVYNEGKPLFGSVSLLVNGKVEYTSDEYIFKDVTAIDLAWKTPETNEQTIYDIKARLNLYDKQIDTATTKLNTFKSTVSHPISDIINIQSITDDKQNIVARAGLLYSSDITPNLHYRVVSPDGKCVIGDSSCMINHSTLGQRGNAQSIQVGDQILRVRYSGQDSSLERFSITSVDPIVGNWNVSLESDSGLIPDAQATEDTQVKIKYRAMSSKPITLRSQ